MTPPIVMLTDIGFFPGLLALLETIKRFGRLDEDQRFVVIEAEQLSQKDKDMLLKFGMNIEYYKIPDYSEISTDWFSMPPNVPYWHGWLRKMLKKLYLFNMTQYKKLVYIDADMLCFGDLRPLLDMDPLSLRPDYGKKQAKYLEGADMMCTGCMVIEPSNEDFNGLVGILHDVPQLLEKWPNYGDQAIINAYFYKCKRDKIHPMDLKWGVNKRTAEHDPGQFMEQMKDAPLLHFVGFKPWQGQDKPCYKEVDTLWYWAWTKVKERMV